MTARSTGCACRGSTPTPSSGASSTRRRATSRSRRTAAKGGRAVFFQCTSPFSIEGDTARAAVEVEAGTRAFVTLADADGAIGVLPPAGEFAERAFEETIRYWKEWSETELAGETAPPMVRRSAITLKLLTYAPSGGVIAAPTTSLPEAFGAERNWDYRYVWVRDASRTIVALFDLGYHDEAHAYMYWITNAAHLTHPRIKTMYGVHGEHFEPEKNIDHLRGYLDSR